MQTFTVTETELEIVGADTEARYTLRRVPNWRVDRAWRRHGSDTLAILDECLDYALLSWFGINYRGLPAPCTPERRRDLSPEVRAALVVRVLQEPYRSKFEQFESEAREAWVTDVEQVN